MEQFLLVFPDSGFMDSVFLSSEFKDSVFPGSVLTDYVSLDSVSLDSVKLGLGVPRLGLLNSVSHDSVKLDSGDPEFGLLWDSIYDLKTFSAAAAYRVNTIWSTGIVVLLEVLSNTIRQMMMGLARQYQIVYQEKSKKNVKKEIFAASALWGERETVWALSLDSFEVLVRKKSLVFKTYNYLFLLFF